MVITTAAGAVAGGRAAVAGRDAVGTRGGFAFILVTTIAKAEQLVAVVHLGAAPGAATIFPKHPHVEGCITVVPEMEGAPPAQAARVGKRLPAGARAMFPMTETSTATHEALLQQSSACGQSPPGREVGSSPAKKRGS